MSDYRFIVEPSLIAAPAPAWGYLREPVLQRMPGGTLFCTFLTGGPTEPHDENLVAATHSADGGASWSPLRVLFDHPTRAAWATELFVAAGPPRFFVHTYDCACDKNELRAFQSVSDDAGRTWTEPVTLPGGVANLSVRQGIVLQDGAWLFPVYWQEQLGDWAWEKTGPGIDVAGIPATWPFRCGALRTENGGASYTLHGHLRAAGKLWEPAAAEIGDGRILMLMRADKTGVLYRSHSADGGRSWSPAEPSAIPNPGSKIALLRHGGALLLLGNQDGRIGREGRRRLSLWLSHDGGESWTAGPVLAEAPTGRVACYPHAFLAEDEAKLYVACDTYREQYLLKIPYAELF